MAIIPALLEIGSWKVTELQNSLVLFSIGYLAFFATAVAFFCWNKGLSMMSPHQAGLFFFLQPIVGSMLGYLLLDETLSPSFAIGSVLVVAGVYSTHLCAESMESNNEE
jgi:drug/metabolite transporter (DMT)-like permease